jgi:hypothetical protein
MSKKLKHFIEEHRREFDEEIPAASMWAGIERSVSKAKATKRFTIRDIYKWTAAAAVFFIAVTSFYFLVVQKNKTDDGYLKSTTDAKSPGTDIKKIAPEFAAEAEAIFESIESRQQALKVIAKEQPALYAQFAEDLVALDSSYRVLRQKATQTPNREVILKAMLQNLQLQAALLAKQLEILNDIKPSKKQKNEETNFPGT